MKHNYMQVPFFTMFILLTLPSIIYAQVPGNYTSVPVKKTYTKFQNPLIKSGHATEVLIVNGQGYLEGDIALGSEADLDAYQNRVVAFAVVNDPNFILNARWDNGSIPFEILDGFSAAEEAIIMGAMNHIAANTNVCFRLRTNQTNYIKFKKYTVAQLGFSGGTSQLGRCAICQEGQEVKLSAVSDAVVRHELCHALGLLHEQSREDRNTFVEILTNNIKPGFENQFAQAIYTSTDVGSYDFSSIMHYFSTAFGKTVNGVTLQTIRRRSNPADVNFGNTSVLSAGDKSAINGMYPVEQICPNITPLAPGELAVGQSKTVTVSANKTNNLTGIYMRSGQRFQFSTSSPSWKNGNTSTDCDGYAGSILDAARRHGDINVMALTGEICLKINADNYTGTYFKIGCSRTLTVAKTGFLVCFANDILLAYGDNSGVVTLTVTRTQ